LKNLAEESGWEEFATLSRCSSEIKNEGWAFHARLEFMNPSAILIGASAIAASVVGLVLFLYPNNHSCHGQVVTLLYIGGASSTSGLLSCQETDGAGETWQHFLKSWRASQIE